MKEIAILDDYQGVAKSLAAWDRLADRARVTRFRDHVSGSALIERLQNFQVIVLNRERTPISAEILKALPNLEMIVTSGMRNASLDIVSAASQGITVCGTQTLGYPTAELTWALILGLARHLPAEASAIADGNWQSTIGWGLRDKVLGVIGYGRIGSDVGRVGQAFGMKVLGLSRSMTPEKAAALGITSASKELLLQTADVVTIHMAPGLGTKHFIGARELSLMKPDAVIINTARASLLDEAALVAALHDRKIRGAALDVFDQEPLPARHRLCQLENVLLTPHLGYVVEENYRVSFGETVENIEAWLDGKPIRVIAPATAAKS